MAASAGPAIGIVDWLSTGGSLTDAHREVWPFSDIDADPAAMSENG
jgi:hypothetical protein